MEKTTTSSRRDVLKGAGAAFTTSLFTGRVKGANDRIAVGFIGLGAMGSSNLGYAMKVPEAQPVALCDVYQPHRAHAQCPSVSGSSKISYLHSEPSVSVHCESATHRNPTVPARSFPGAIISNFPCSLSL